MTFGSAGSAAGQVLLAQSGAGVAGSGVAVSAASHDVYVADTGNRRVDEFEADGTFVRAWGWEVNGVPGFGSCTLACQAGSSGSAPGQFTTPAFIAVDNSAGPSAGDVYVGDAGDQIVSKFTAEGVLIESWGVEGQLDGSSTLSGSFGQVAGVAVDSAGVLQVLSEANLLFRFEQDGTFLGELGTARGTDLAGLAVDGSGNFFKLNGDESVEEFTASGVDVGQVAPGEEDHGQGVATAGGDLYVADRGAVRHYVFSEPGRVMEPGGTTCVFEPFVPCPASDSFGSSEPTGGELTAGTGLGVDTSTGSPASGNVYVTDAATGRVDVYAAVVLADVETGAASEVQPTAATLTGTVNPDGVEVSDCHFDYGTTTGYGQSVPCEQTVGSGTSPVSVTANLTGLETGTTYHYRLQAANVSGPNLGSDQSFSTPPKPAITGETAANLTSSTADLSAQVNPGGQNTTCQFEYGTTTEYTGTPLPCTPQPGAGTGDVTIEQHLTSLTPNTTYHWRVTAINAAGTTIGPDHTFIYSTTSEPLPDNRAYEMVTPIHKNAALIGDIFSGAQSTVAEDGQRIVAPTVQCFGEATACSVNKGGAGTPYEFTRTPAGWATTQLAPPAQQFESAAAALTNVNTGTALFDMPSPPNGQYDFYERSVTGAFTDVGPVTDDPQGPERLGATLATSDFSHVVFGDLSKPMWPSFDATEGASLYEYVGEGNLNPKLVGVSGGSSSTDLLSTCGTFEANLNTAKPDSLSADGRVTFFTPVAEHVGQPCFGSGANEGVEVASEGVFARVDGDETLNVSARSVTECSTECSASLTAGAYFEGASRDGARVFFTSTQQLTDSASEDSVHGSRRAPVCSGIMDSNGCNLYVASLVLGGAGHASRVVGLRAVSAGDLSGGGPRVQGVMGVSSDGLRVFFVARGVLSAVANDQGAVAQDGGENLYVAEGSGPVRFIATLAESASDEEQWTEARANVSSDGRVLVFTSQAPLTRDDSRPVGGAAQVFRYDAVSGALARISVGEKGFNDNGNAGSGDAQLASVVFAQLFTAGAGRTGPSLSGDGSRVFFMSPIGLTRGALNDVQIGANRVNHELPAFAQNVYEWVGGHVFLVSDGRDANVLPQTACNPGEISAVCLIGVDASGSNVFFSSADQLVPSDSDTQVDIYDARVCEPGAGNPCVAGPAPEAAGCDGEECHGIPAATPGKPAGGSATLSGLGNVISAPPGGKQVLTRAQRLRNALKACERRYARSRKRRLACERTARKQFGAHKARKARHTGNTGRVGRAGSVVRGGGAGR